MNKGTSRKLRTKKKLKANYISMDERTLLDLIHYTLELTKFINFSTAHNTKIAGGWRSFFLKDSAFILAEIAHKNLNEYKTSDEFQQKNDAMINYVENQIQLLTESNYKGSLLLEMTKLLEAVRGDEASDNHSHQEHLAHLHKRIYGNLVFIKEKAIKKFEKEISASSSHYPQIGLLLTFFELFKYVQQDMNLLTKKHLDYYYQELLEQQQKKLPPHTAILALQLQKESEDTMVSEGDAFNFTLAEGQDTLFQAVSSTQINSASIADIRTLYRNDFELYGEAANGDDFNFNLLYESHLMANGDNFINTLKNDQVQFPAICGEKTISKSDAYRNITMSALGTLVSSPSLMLAEGSQEITLSFYLNEASYRKTEERFEAWEQEGKLRNNSALNKHAQKKLADIFRNAFLVFITGEEGWQPIDRFKTLLNPTERSLNFLFELRKNKEKLVPFNGDIHEGNFALEWPCIKILLNNNAIIHPYTFLQKLVIDTVVIETKVNKVTDVSLSNSIGELDSSIPFTPFGPSPYPGSYLRIEHPLILQRNLAELSIELDWNGLPQDLDGFKGHYQEYPGTMENTSFKAAIGQSRNVEKRWGKIKEDIFNLFESKPNSKSLKSKTKTKVRLEKLFFNEHIDLSNDAKSKRSSPLYLILTEPEMAFGHHQFSEIYSETVMKQSSFRKKKLPLPKQPYTPVLEQLALSYTNVAKEIMLRKRDALGDDGSDIKLLHLYPFGHVQVFPGPIRSSSFLLPQIDYKGSLFLGLKKVKMTDTISIGFDLEPAVYAHTLLKKPSVSWEYLLNNEWVGFKELVLEDSTDGLAKPGIVKLRMPKVVQYDTTRLPGGYFWVRAGITGPEDLTSKIRSIFTQAVAVSSTQHSSVSGKDDTPRAIKIGFEQNSKIVQIKGPIALQIQRDVEKENVFNARVSERLRHKRRGVTHWDIEHLVLDQFKQVDKVRVYGRSSYPDELVKGSNVQIVVIPASDTNNDQHQRRKELAYSLLKEIKQYVQQFVSPHVCIEVSNPVYEYLRVRCFVRVNDFSQSGHLYNELNAELIDFLSPNIENSFMEKGFETAISKAEIQNFIENRPYVEDVSNLSVFQIVEVNGAFKIIDTEIYNETNWLRTVSPYAILTSAPEHHITIVPTKAETLPEIAYIDDVEIGLDFIISDDAGNYN